MARCNCSSRTCACVIVAGDGAAVSGAGTNANPYVIALEGGGGSESGWSPGDVKLTAQALTPAGWLECAGQAISRDAYSDLYDAIGETYGSGNGSTTFNLPNMSGRFPMGAGGSNVLGGSGGESTVVLTSGNLPPHTHLIDHNHPEFATESGGAHRHNLDMSNEDGSNNARIRRGGDHVADSNGAVESTGTHTHNVNVPPYTGSSGPGPGASTPFSILPPYRVLRFLIKT